MALTRVPKRQDGIAAGIGALPDVARVDARPGQVLLYPQHVPLGLYLVVSGAVRKEGSRLLDAARGPFLVPAIDDLERPAEAGYTVVREAEMYFIPRSLALHDSGVRGLLEKAGLVSRPAGA